MSKYNQTQLLQYMQYKCLYSNSKFDTGYICSSNHVTLVYWKGRNKKNTCENEDITSGFNIINNMHMANEHLNEQDRSIIYGRIAWMQQN